MKIAARDVAPTAQRLTPTAVTGKVGRRTSDRLQAAIGNQAVLRLQQSAAPEARGAALDDPETQSVARRGLQGPASSLETTTARTMGTRLGADFSDVQIHSDAAAAISARALGAKAYAFGQHVVFGSGRYAPHTGEGRGLLAHELTHVTQQSLGSSSAVEDAEREAAYAEAGGSPLIRGGGPPRAALRLRADDVGSTSSPVATGASASPQASSALAKALELLRSDVETTRQEAWTALRTLDGQRAAVAHDLAAQEAVVHALDQQGRTFADDMEPRIKLGLLRTELAKINRDGKVLHERWAGAVDNLAALKSATSTAQPGDVAKVLRGALERERRTTTVALEVAIEHQAFLARQTSELEASATGLDLPGNADEILAQRFRKSMLRDETQKTKQEQAALIDRLAQLEHEGALVTAAATDPTALHGLIASRSEAAKRETTRSLAAGGGWKDVATETRTATVGGARFSTETSQTLNVDVARMAASKKSSTTVSSGARSLTRSQTTGIDLKAGEISKDVETERRTKVGNIETSETTKKGWKAGAGGVKFEQSSRSVDLDRQLKETSTTSEVTRGGGAIGIGRTTSSTTGTVNEEGDLVSGRSTTTRVDAKVLAGPGGVGASLGASRNVEATHREGVKTGVKVSPSGQFVVSVDEVPDSEPKQYRLILALKIGGTIGGSHQREKSFRDTTGAKTGSSITADASVSLGAEWGMAFTRILTPEQTAQYFRDLDLAEGGDVGKGSWPEFAIIRTAARSQWKMDAVQQIFRMLTGEWAATFAKLGEGDTVEFTRSVKAGLDLGGGGKTSAGGSASIGGGVGRTQELRYVLSRKRGKARVSVERSDERERSLKGSAGYGAGSFGIQRAEKSSTEGGLTFELDPAGGSFEERVAAIMDAGDEGQLQRIAAERPADVVKRSTAHGSAEEGKETLNLGVASLTFEQGASIKESRTEEQGKVVKRWESSNTLGGTVGLLGLSYTTGVEESMKAKSGPAGASADASTTRSHTDVGASVERLGELLVRDPIGLLTGGAKVMQTTKHIGGIEFTNDDLAIVAEAAASEAAWETGVVVRPGHVRDWREASYRIVVAGSTPEAADAALAWFVGRSDHGRVDVIARLAAKLKVGKRYEWPAGTTEHRKTFSELVVLDPTAGPMATARTGEFEAAAAELDQRLIRLRALGTLLDGELQQYVDSRAVAEMIDRTAERKRQVQDAIRVLEKAMRATDDPESSAQALQDEAAAQRDRVQAARMVARTHKALERKLLGEIADERRPFLGVIPVKNDIPRLISKLRAIEALWPRWEAAIREIESAGGRVPGEPLASLRPDKEAWHREYQRVGWINR